jgi:hypothetical protein
MPNKSIIHESVLGVLSQVGVKPRASGISGANHRSLLRETDEGAVMEKHAGVVVRMKSHPKLSDCSWDVAGIAEAKTQAFAACKKAGGFPIFEAVTGKFLDVRFTRDEKKATVANEAALAVHLKEAKSESEDDETDGTGEPSGDTTTNVKAKNDKGVGTKKGVKADNKGDENSSECNEAVADPETGEKVEMFNKNKLAKFKDLIAKKKALAGKKDKTAAEKTEEAAIDAELDLISESFYASLKHGVTFVLYENGNAEIIGLTEEEIAPFGGTAPAVPNRYSKKAKDAGPNSKVDMGVLSLYKTENMDAQSQKILTGKDFKALGWGTPGKGTGKQGKWSDSGKHPLDSAKKLKAGQE